MQAEGRKKALKAFFFSMAATLAADQASKALVRLALPEGGRSVRLLGDFLALRQCRNPGISFGLFRGGNPAVLILVAALPVAALTALALWGRGMGRAGMLGMGLICGGAVGNIIDRLVFGQVIDFIEPSFWPAFNLADAAVVVGVFLFVAGIIKKEAAGAKGEEERGG
jgi:signal peptidase II